MNKIDTDAKNYVFKVNGESLHLPYVLNFGTEALAAAIHYSIYYLDEYLRVINTLETTINTTSITKINTYNYNNKIYLLLKFYHILAFIEITIST